MFSASLVQWWNELTGLFEYSIGYEVFDLLDVEVPEKDIHIQFIYQCYGRCSRKYSLKERVK